MRLDRDHRGDPAADQHHAGGQGEQSVARHRVDRPLHGAQLVGHVLVEDAGALLEVLGGADEGVDVGPAGFDAGFQIGGPGRLEHQFLVGDVRRRRGEPRPADAHDAYPRFHGHGYTVKPWTSYGPPTRDDIEGANVTRFMRAHGIETYRRAAVARSVADIAWFWDAVVRDLGHRVLRPPTTQVVDRSRGPEWATWFTGGHDQPGAPAASTGGPSARPTRSPSSGRARTARPGGPPTPSSARMTDRLANGAAAAGRAVRATPSGIFLPMAIETVAAIMACAKLGAVWVPIFSGLRPRRGGDPAGRRARRGADHGRRIPCARARPSR